MVRLESIRGKLAALKPTLFPKQNIDPDRWGVFLMDVEECDSSIYMMKFRAYIPLAGRPFRHDPSTFPRMKIWQQAAALEVVYKFVKEGKMIQEKDRDAKTKCTFIAFQRLDIKITLAMKRT